MIEPNNVTAPKKINHPLFKTILLLSCAALAVVGIIGYTTSCNQVVVKVTPNSAKDHFAVQYNLECAALSGSSNLIVLDSEYKVYFLSFFEPVFISEYDYNNGLHANWIDEKVLEIIVPGEFKIYRRNERSNDINIHYITK